MAERLRDKFPDATVELIKGDKGIFDVALDGGVVYSKYKLGISVSDVSEDDVIEKIMARESE